MDKADQKILEQLNKEVPHERTCRVCGGVWPIEQADIDLLEKIVVPLPTECPECNHRHRMVFRNEVNMYKRRCEETGVEMVSVYSPDKPQKVWEQNYWTENFDPLSLGREYDPKRSFMEQFAELWREMPFPSLFGAGVNENSEYTNHSASLKDCYLIFLASGSENCMYGKGLTNCRDCVDCYKVLDCENCYENVYCTNNNNCICLLSSENCYDCHFSQNLMGCQNCLLCFNLQNKQYCVRNKQVTREEFERIKREWDYVKLKIEYLKVRQTAIVKYASIYNSENASGDYIYNSKDVHQCFAVVGFENCRYCIEGYKSFSDAYYMYSSGLNSQLQYNGISCGIDGYQAVCCQMVYFGSRTNYYSYYCRSVQNLFGCIGLKNKQYCVLNKQYSAEDWERLVEQIKLDMLERGEYGEAFPVELSHFGYNETLAQELFPLSKEEALRRGFKWSDYEAEAAYSGPWHEPLPIREYFNEGSAQELLAGVLKCEVTGRPFKIMGAELAFYLKNNIPIPRRYWNQRHTDRLNLKNPYRLWHRQCMCVENGHEHNGRCSNEFKTTYAPERDEKVCCENCYQKSVL